MANISNYLEEKILNHVMRNDSYTSPTDIYVGLIDDNATDSELEDGNLDNEITDYGGDRKSITFTEPSQVDGKATIENDSDIDFEDMPEVTIAYAVIMDSEAADGTGNILYWCPADKNKTANSGDTYRIPEGDLTLDLD